MINPKKDGITHINIYSQAKTELGQMLSNFCREFIDTPDGKFLSVEGYWYWLSIEDCEEKEVLKTSFGHNAKTLGKKILQSKEKRFDNDFEKKITDAIWCKFSKNKNLLLPKYYNIPFEHYYNYNGTIVDVKDKYKWMMDAIDNMRNKIIEERKQ
jgi:predicted NAD-dependent protein-ADP-ribosyltransferase YbiA (DUF1768 family)